MLEVVPVFAGEEAPLPAGIAESYEDLAALRAAVAQNREGLEGWVFYLYDPDSPRLGAQTWVEGSVAVEGGQLLVADSDEMARRRDERERLRWSTAELTGVRQNSVILGHWEG